MEIEPKKLAEKAMLVRFSIHQWGSTRDDKSVTKEIEDKYGAKNAGKYDKKLLREFTEDIQKEIGKARTFHYDNTLPWDRGVGVLLNKNYFDYIAAIREYESKISSLVEAGMREFDNLIEKEKVRLGGLYDVNDYPAPDVLAGKYKIALEISPIPNSDHFRVELHDEEVAKIKEDIDKVINNKVNAAMKDAWQRLYNAVYHMAERVYTRHLNPDAKLFESVIENIVTVCDILPKLNITDDPELERMTQEIRAKLTGYNVEELKEDAEVRKDAMLKATDILKQMEGYV
jgi:hypothetical protein